MKTLIQTLATGITCLMTSFSGHAAEVLKEYQGIALHFPPSHSLDTAEIDKVIELAGTQGIKKIASIRALNVHPSNSYYLQVASTERTNNRLVEWDLLNIDRLDWSKKGADGRATAKAVRGPFWVGDQSHHPQQRVIFTEGLHVVRAKVGDKVSLDLADKIFVALVENRIDFHPPELRGKAAEMSLDKLSGIHRLDPTIAKLQAEDAHRRDQEPGPVQVPEFLLTFDCGYLCWLHLRIKFDGERILVLHVMTIVS